MGNIFFSALLIVYFVFNLALQQELLIDKNKEWLSNIYEYIIDSATNNSDTISETTRYKTINTWYIDLLYPLDIYIPKILLSSLESKIEGDIIFNNYDIEYNTQIIKNWNNYIDLWDDKLYLWYLYFYCIDLDDSWICDNWEVWELR